MIESQTMPYAPGNRTIDVIRRIREGRSGNSLTTAQLQSLGVPAGNADRVQRALVTYGIIEADDFALTPAAVALRKAVDDEYPALLAGLIRKAYAGVFEIIDPATATRNDLVNAFRPYDPAGQRDNMIALFVAVCREAKLMSGDAEPQRRPTGAAKKVAASVKSAPTATKKRFTDSGAFLHPVLDMMLADVKQKFTAGAWTKEERDKFVTIFPLTLDTYLPISSGEKDEEEAS